MLVSGKISSLGSLIAGLVGQKFEKQRISVLEHVSSTCAYYTTLHIFWHRQVGVIFEKLSLVWI